MKQTAKRVLSLLCVMAMLFTCLSGLTFTVGAAEGGTTAYPNKWTIYYSETGWTQSYKSGERFEKGFTGFNAQIPAQYEMEDVALYIHMTLDSGAVTAFEKGGSIELAQKTMDKSERSWGLAAPEWQAGENEVLLKLSASGSYPGGEAEFDLHSPINFFRMFATPGSAVFTSAATVTIHEIALVDITTAGVLFGEDDTYLQLSKPLSTTPNTIEASVKMDGVATSWSIGYPNGGRYSANMTNIGAGTVGAGEGAPEGMGYYAVKVSPVDEWSWAMANQKFTVNFPKMYEKEDLALAFWLYTSTGEIGNGSLELTSSGTWDKNELTFQYGNYIENPKAGWNYVELPLASPTAATSGANGVFDYTAANFIRWVGSGPIEAEMELRISEMKFIALDSPVEQLEESDALVTDSDSVFFGNTNTADENPIALFADMYGNVGWAWGNKRYTTDFNVCTGEWIDLALVRDMTAGKFYLYADGELVAEHNATDTADIVPTVAHTIGADGLGEVTKGMIADVRVWSDVRTAEEIAENRVAKTGNKTSGLTADEEGLIDAWFLCGNLNYVLGGNVTKSIKGNDLVFLGSRADDWVVDYEVPTDVIGEDYYTMVFIPDTQEVSTGAFTEEWMASAQWIADNVEKENIVHVIGAGDTTWTDSPGQWQLIKNGFDLFTDKVSWSNMTGNHDYPGSTRPVNDTTYTIRNSTNYNNYFGMDYINSTAAANTYVGSFADDYDIYGTEADENGKYSGAENSYYRFQVNDVNWMILQLEYHPRVSVINWACDILEQYPDDNVIFTTHGYIGADNGRYSTHWMPYTKSDAEIGGYIGELMPSGAVAWPGGSEEPIWTEILYKHNNVKLLLCGHDGTTDGHVLTRWDENAAGNKVPQVMINAQDLDVEYFDGEALAMLGILRFSADGTKVDIQYYSAYHDASYHPSNQEMRSLTLTTGTCDHSKTEDRAQVDPTCTETGLTAGVWCIPCARYISGGEVIPSHAKEDRVIVEPTCTETGLTAGVWCTVCEKYLSGGETIPAHNKVDRDKVEPTCTKDGAEAGVWCTVCRKYVSGGEAIPAHVTEERPKVSATCTEPGHTAGVWCTECEKYVSGGAVLPVHAKEERAEIPATETTPGRTAGVWCIPCEKYISGGEIIPPTGGGEDPAPTAKLGDVNGDNKIDSTDARLVLQYAVGKIKADAINIDVADVNGDNKVDSTDARLILQYAVGKIQSFPKA